MNLVDLQQIFAEESAKAFDKDIIRVSIRKHLDGIVKDAMESMLRTYGKVGKELKTHIEDNCGIDLSKVIVPNYSDIIIAELNAALQGAKDHDLKLKAEEFARELVTSAPTSVTLQEIVEQYKEWLKSGYEDELVELGKKGELTKEGKYSIEIDYSVEDDSSIGSFENHILQVANLITNTTTTSYGLRKKGQHAGDLKLHFYRSKSNNSCSICYCYLDGKMSGEKLELKDWCNLTDFEKYLYKLEKAKTLVVLDEPTDLSIELDNDCSC